MKVATLLYAVALLAPPAGAWVAGPTQAEPGQQLSPAPGDDADASGPPLGMPQLAIFSGDCRRCLRECLGAKVQAAQVAAMKVQAPLSLVTWYLFRNRPFKMWPLEDALRALANVHPAAWGAAASAAYMSCNGHCDMDCPYPGGLADPADAPELDKVDPTDTRFLSLLYQRGSRGGGGGGGGSFSAAVSDMFRVV